MECAKCGVDLENGGIDKCSILNDLDPDQAGTVRILRFCRDREEGGRKIKGCTRKILSTSNTKHLEELRAQAN